MIVKEQRKIDEYYELSPTQFGVVQSLVLQQCFDANDVMKQSLFLVLRRSLDHPANDMLRLEFYGVRHLEVGQPDLSLVTLPHLEILLGRDVPTCTDPYYVRDPSQNRVIRFHCEDFVASVKTTPSGAGVE